MNEPATSVSPRSVWGVAALLLATSDTLAARFAAVAVQGEVSGLSRAASGHCYFSLKDAQGAAALLRCAMFRRAASLLDFNPADGQRVEVRGRLGVYEPRGELQLIVESMRRQGAGTLYEEFLRLRARLEAAGLFVAERKRAIPPLPRTLGVVTSLTAAALSDVLSALARRAPHVRVIVYPSPVQGTDAPAALVQAIQLAARRLEIDTLLLVRGGGALEDLWAFNDERVVRAVADCPVPVICGVGHETDVTLCDLAADLRAPTPTAAAELAAPPREELLQALAAPQRALRVSILRALQTHAQRVDRLALRLSVPASSLGLQGQRLDALGARLQRCLQQPLVQHRQRQQSLQDRLLRAGQGARRQVATRLDAWRDRLQAIDPRRVLQRGYAWIEAADGRPVLSVRLLSPGQSVRAVWSDGKAQATIESIEPHTPQG